MSLELTAVASLLETTMTNAGYFDDYDEILHYMMEDDDVSIKDVYDLHDSVIISVNFLNNHTNNQYDPQGWQRNFDEIVLGEG